jgi:hypothetical protein
MDKFKPTGRSALLYGLRSLRSVALALGHKRDNNSHHRGDRQGPITLVRAYYLKIETHGSHANDFYV